jgi:hypothetical protein
VPDDDLRISPAGAFVFASSFLILVQRNLQTVPPGLEDLFVGQAVN